jgi:peptide deformylase
MAVLPLVIAPDPVLKTKAKPVEKITAEILALLEDMAETMYANQGIGLAANQVGKLHRVVVVDVQWREDSDERNPLKLINPELLWQDEQYAAYEEGCLSFPEEYGEVERPATIRLRYLDIHGKQQEMEADGILATCIQHEIDHIDGITFVDHLSRLKRDTIHRRLSKLKKMGAVPTRTENPYNREHAHVHGPHCNHAH